MTSIIEKRRSLHKNLANQQQQNDTLQLQVSQLQALANMGTSTCMIAHEINNLLMPLINYAALAMNNPQDRELTQKALQKTIQNSERASKIMKSILTTVTGEAQKKVRSPLLGLVEDVFTCLCRDFSKDSIKVEIQIPQDLTILAVPVEIQQIFMNLILNARDAMLGKGGTLKIKAEKTGDIIRIEISDTGCGIEPGDIEKVFEPFFTTKTDKKTGCGLGLAFCKKVVESYGGSISVNSKPNSGSTFRVVIPE